MDEQPSSGTRLDDDVPGSPKRKKVRAKYAPKACVSCRRSKLKCSGENPCQRCLDSGRRCFYSEDQTAAEALQNLSRPVPAHAFLPTNGNGNGLSRRNILPRSEVLIERRASDASVLGGSSIEARMARIEGMMEALIQDRGIGIIMTSRGSMDREESNSDSFDTALQAPMDAYPTNLIPVKQANFSYDSPESRPRHSISAASPSTSLEPPGSVRIGSRHLTFPSHADYQRYMDYFFVEVNPCHPCVNEVEFRLRSEQMLATRVIHASEMCFLALNYIIFACTDILTDTMPAGLNSKLPGWQWFQAADELVGKRKLSGRGDLSLVQYLLWEALYLAFADKPNAAYNSMGLACRHCFQFGLHQQPSWRTYTPFEAHMRQRIFWTVYFTDRWISLCCGRPYGIRDLDIDIEQPAWVYDLDLHPDQPLPEEDKLRSANLFLTCMISWGKLVGDVWDHVFATLASKHGIDPESAAVLEARIKHWTEFNLSSIPLLPPGHSPEIRHIKQHAIAHTHLNHLRLLLQRSTMISLKYDGSTGRLCGDLAIDTIQRIKAYAPEAKLPSSFRFHMTAALSGTALTLATLLVRDLGSIGLQDKADAYADSFRDAIRILHDLSIYLQIARRVTDDLKDVVQVVTTILNGGPPDIIPSNLQNIFPYSSLDFAQQPGENPAEFWNGLDTATLDSWDLEPQPNTGGYGVPWI